MGRLHEDEEGRLREQLLVRSERLVRALRAGPTMPAHLLGRFVWAVVWTAVPLCGSELRDLFLQWLVERHRDSIGCCAFCGAYKDDVNDPMCHGCQREVDLETAMDREPNGGVM